MTKRETLFPGEFWFASDEEPSIQSKQICNYFLCHYFKRVPEALEALIRDVRPVWHSLADPLGGPRVRVGPPKKVRNALSQWARTHYLESPIVEETVLDVLESWLKDPQASPSDWPCPSTDPNPADPETPSIDRSISLPVHITLKDRWIYFLGESREEVKQRLREQLEDELGKFFEKADDDLYHHEGLEPITQEEFTLQHYRWLAAKQAGCSYGDICREFGEKDSTVRQGVKRAKDRIKIKELRRSPPAPKNPT